MKLRLLAILLLMTFLTGCGMSAGELYRLPEAPEDYYDLQIALNEVLTEGYNYLAPASGVRQEPVQRQDLNADGQDEVIVFFRSSADGAVKVYVFTKVDGNYETMAVIDGAGSAVAAVEYADLDGQGDQELIVTYQVSESVTQALLVYHFDAEGIVPILTASCSQYELVDLDDDGLSELFCLTGNGAETAATVEYYDGQDGELRRSEELRLSYSYDGLRRVQQGLLSDGTPAMLLTGSTSDGLLATDLFAAEGERLRQIAPAGDILRTGLAGSSNVYPMDIDDDGMMEVPQVEALPGSDGASHWAIRWYGVSGSGGLERRMLTYQNFTEQWYVALPETWDGAVSVEEKGSNTAVATVTFRRSADTDPSEEELLTIYTLRGISRQSYAEERALTILYSDSDIIYAVDLNEDAHAWVGTITMAQVSEMFHMSRSY